MANYTTNYNLEMPEQNDFYNVDVQNENMKKIDQAIKEAGNNPELEGNVAGLVEKIGTTTDVGGSSSAGSTMAKLNALLKTIGNSDTALADLIVGLSNRGVVKSIQYGRFFYTETDSRYTITISKINVKKSFVILNGGIPLRYSDEAMNVPFHLMTLNTDSIVIYFDKPSSFVASSAYGSYQVIELY